MIRIEDFSKRFKDTLAVDKLSFEVKEGTICGFVGKNGAGKTTTMRTLMNILFPDEGVLELGGFNVIDDVRLIRRIVSYMPGDSNFYPKLSGKDLISYTAKMNNHDVKEYQKIAEYFELDLTKQVETLSLGNKKKLALVLALHPSKKLLLLDEPTNGLDPLMQKKFFDLMLEYKNRGVCVFLSSHNLNEVERYCDRVLIIKNGTLVEDLNLLDRDKGLKHKVVYQLSDLTVMEQIVDGDLKGVLKELSTMDLLNLEIRRLSLEEEMIKYYGEDNND